MTNQPFGYLWLYFEKRNLVVSKDTIVVSFEICTGYQPRFEIKIKIFKLCDIFFILMGILMTMMMMLLDGLVSCCCLLHSKWSSTCSSTAVTLLSTSLLYHHIIITVIIMSSSCHQFSSMGIFLFTNNVDNMFKHRRHTSISPRHHRCHHLVIIPDVICVTFSKKMYLKKILLQCFPLFSRWKLTLVMSVR